MTTVQTAADHGVKGMMHGPWHAPKNCHLGSMLQTHLEIYQKIRPTEESDTIFQYNDILSLKIFRPIFDFIRKLQTQLKKRFLGMA